MAQPGMSRLHSITYGTETITYQLQFSVRKTLGITVHPDLSVLVTAPEGKEMDTIEAKVKKRAGWILKQQDYFRAFLPPLPPRRFVAGETHCYLGRQYRLKIYETANESVKLKGAYIHIGVRDKSESKRVEGLFMGWLAEHAENQFAKSLERCIDRFENRRLQTPRIELRKMSKRWGSVGKNGVVYLNPELVSATRHCIDYVVTHELCHILIPDHSSRFYKLLGKVMPDWETWKSKLEYSAKG